MITNADSFVKFARVNMNSMQVRQRRDEGDMGTCQMCCYSVLKLAATNFLSHARLLINTQTTEYWDPISDDAKILISHLLCVNADERLSAREALQSNWISVASDEELNKHDMLANLTKLRQFNGRRKFRAAVASVLAVNKMANFLAFDTFQMDDMELPMLSAKSTKKMKSGRKKVKVYGDEEEA